MTRDLRRAWCQRVDRRRALGAVALIVTALGGAAGADPPPMEFGVVTAGPTPSTVALSNLYTNPVVVCSVNYVNNTSPVVVRVDNVTAAGFDVWLQNPGDGVVPENDLVSCLIMEAGSWEINGLRCEARRYVSTRTDHDQSWVGEQQSYLQSYTKPVVVGQVMSANDADWSVFWAHGGSRSSPPNAGRLYTGKHVAEDSRISRADELVGFIVIESGHGDFDGVAFDACVSPDTVGGVGDAPPYAVTFTSAFAAPPAVLLTSAAGMDGRDGGWPVIYGDPPSADDRAYLAHDEDQIADTERNHTTEQVSLIAFGWSPPLFADVSGQTGFDLQTTTSADRGSGLHWADLDADGDLDAIITGDSQARLMVSNSAGQSFFATSFGTGDVRHQGALLDIDNDGDVDFWAVGAGGSLERCYANDGSASFSDLGNLGLGAPLGNEATAAADVDRDGWCDVLVLSANGNWIGENAGGDPPELSGTTDPLYGLNNSGDVGDGGYCTAGDVNNDGYLDLFYHFNGGRLFRSNGDGTFTRDNGGISVATGPGSRIGSAWADYDNDGDLDLFVPRLADGQPGYLWRNDGGSFTNVAASAGITDTSAQRSCCWGDYDNDGHLDLYITTASGPNRLYHNEGDGTFEIASEGVDASGAAHDAVFVDYDNDGDLDLAVVREGDTNVLLNNGLNDTSYLKVRLIGAGRRATNTAAIGVRVDLYAADGVTFLARREVGVARGYGGTEPLWAHFGGLDAALSYVVRAHFVTGEIEVPVIPQTASSLIGGTIVDQMLTIEEPDPSENLRVVEWREVDPIR
jgi:hypothetical protein